jgi:putative heme-binding domain-containing protein
MRGFQNGRLPRRPGLSLAGILLVLAFSSAVFGQHGRDSRDNPFNSATDVVAGRRIYLANCAVCHGIDGRGGRGTDLTRGEFRHGAGDEDLFRSITKGIKGTEMPPVLLTGQETFQVIAFLRSLSRGRGRLAARGDPARGRAIIEGKGMCLSCHSIGGTGALSGPDLTAVGMAKSYAELESALLRPDEQVLPAHWQIEAELASGAAVRGVRLNEDIDSAQILDAQGRLLSIDKRTARKFSVQKTGLMPSYEGKLSRQEIDDVLASLAALR